MAYEEILFSTEGSLGFLTLNKPEKINALSIKMVGEITDVLERIEADESVKVLIIRASGKNFCAGHDLSEMVDDGVKEYKRLFDRCTRMMQKIHELPQPVIAQVQGVATAAGCQLAAWCDLVVAEEGARFATPGVTLGLFCTTPMVAVTRAIGRKAALEMLLTGRRFPAKEAKEIGLINRVVPLEELSRETESMARGIAKASRLTLEIGKEAFYAQADLTDDKAFRYANRTMVMNNMTNDAQKGIKAFIGKTDVEWEDS